MWRRICSSQLKAQALSLAQSLCRSAPINPSSANLSLFSRPLFASRYFSVESAGASVKKTVDVIMPIATGHEREELEAELEGRNILAIDFPLGPFGTKEAPAVVKSYYDRRIVGCPGGEGEDEHDVVWFWLEKGKPHECPVCTQHFVLEVVGPGGDPEGHGDEHH